jgi:hypothetical protein
MIERNRMRFRPLCFAAAATLASSASLAGVTLFDSLAEWNAATSAQTVRVTFEEPIWPVNQVLTGAWTLDGITFQGFAGTPSPNIFVADFGNVFASGNWMTANGDENIDITVNTPTHALAFDTTANQFGPALIDFFDETGNEIASIKVPTNTFRFVGVTSDQPIRRVNFASVLGAQQNTGFDTIRTAEIAPPLCLGDADGDGDVDFADVTAVLTSFGMTYSSPGGLGDADQDLNVDFADITSVLTNFNSVCP